MQQYGALSGGDKLSDPATEALTIILDALNVSIIRPNVIIFGQTEWWDHYTN